MSKILYMVNNKLRLMAIFTLIALNLLYLSFLVFKFYCFIKTCGMHYLVIILVFQIQTFVVEQIN